MPKRIAHVTVTHRHIDMMFRKQNRSGRPVGQVRSGRVTRVIVFYKDRRVWLDRVQFLQVSFIFWGNLAKCGGSGQVDIFLLTTACISIYITIAEQRPAHVAIAHAGEVNN